MGCAAVGWVAAIAEWLFDMRIVIYAGSSDATANLLYSNLPPGMDPQLHLVFDNTMDGSVSTPRQQLQIVRKTYLLPDCWKLPSLDQRATAEGKFLSSGRVPWQSCLHDTFGDDFDRLLKVPMNFGAALGYAARLFSAIVEAEPGLPEKYMGDCRAYFDAASGQGFVQHSLGWLPELSPLKRSMDGASRVSFQKAKEGYEEKFAAIQRLCACGVCRNFEDVQEGKGYCLVMILETTIVLCQVTAGLTILEGLHPTRSGIELFYNRQIAPRFRNKDDDDEDGERLDEEVEVVGPFAYVLWTNSFMDLNLEERSQAMEGRLVDAMRLFTGRDTETDPTTSAVSESGICAYLDLLRDFSIGAEFAGRVTVIPGHIIHSNRPFHEVNDNEVNVGRLTGSVVELDAMVAQLDDLVIEVSETSRSLSVNYLFRARDATRSPPLSLRAGPADLLDRAHKARGLVHCGKTIGTCRRRRTRSLSVEGKLPFCRVAPEDASAITICDTSHGGEYLRAAALRIATAKLQQYHYILSDTQCIDCCLREAVVSNRTPVLVIADVGKEDLM